MKLSFFPQQLQQTEKSKKQFSHYLGQTTDETIFLSPATPADTESQINCIKPNKAIGPNRIPRKILKQFKTEFSEPLSGMINVSVSKGIPVGNYMFKVNNRDTRTRCEICSQLTIKTPERVVLASLLLTLNIFTPCSSVFIVNFEQVNVRWNIS